MIETPTGQHRVAVCLAATDEVKTFFAHDYARMLAYTCLQRPNDAFAGLVSTGSLIPQQRELLTDAVMDRGYTHGLFLDSDMRFPRDTLLRLLDRDLPIVGAGYTERHVPFRPHVIKDLQTDERVYTLPESTGTEKVAALGFGCILLRRDALEAIDRPRFTVGWNMSESTHIGEDIFFCFKAGQKGVPIHVDHDLTKEVAHIGLHEYTAETAVAARPVMVKVEEKGA